MQDQPQQPRDTISSMTAQQERHGKRQTQSGPTDEPMDEEFEDDMSTKQGLRQAFSPQNTSGADAAALWAYCSHQTHSLSLLLTEQLRLILAPTTATKLRGDFRTGKRLNIKRIIPYIASGYKRDKIWMRRSIPSKRNYQIMLAVDDSKSMSETGADLLAFSTLAMLSKSLSMLEVGDLSIVTFGNDPQIRVAHPFGQPFTGAESGIEVFKSFTFQQLGTKVPNLLKQSISMFEDARLKSNANDDTWQLQLIISDGQISNYDTIRRLVRTAYEQKIVVVLIIVDALETSVTKDLVFDWEEVDSPDGQTKKVLKPKEYLENFPFQYYVVVKDVVDLPGVLANVLRGWFESVVNVG